MVSRAVNLTGRIYGRLTVVKQAGVQNEQALWECQCRCGNTTTVVSGQLNRKPNPKRNNVGGTKSCGACYDQYKYPKEWLAWRNMQNRCEDPNNKSYPDYGGRGIIVCARWRGNFLDFLDDMGKAESDRLSIDRINNNGNYEPGNCRWATWYQQNSNRRNNQT